MSDAPTRRSPTTPERRERLRAASKARWGDPAACEKMIAEMRASRADPVYRQKMGAVTKSRWADPVMREKMIAGMRSTKRRRKRDPADR